MAIWFAALALPLAVLSFAMIDVNRASVEKRHLQDALDAATLLAARSTATTTDEVQPMAQKALNAQLTGMGAATVTSAVFKVAGTKITGTATANVKPVIANLWLGGDMVVHANTEVTRASTNLEMAMVLDVTQSMSGTKIADLQTAARDLVDMVISDVQSPYYSKAALVPFSVGVNVGSYAAAVRGPVVGTKTVTGAAWQNTSALTISGITKASPGVVTTSNNHGFANGDYVYITGVVGMTQVNNKVYRVANKANKTFQLSGVNTSGYSTRTSGGTVRKCLSPDCGILVTAVGHGYTTGQLVMFKNVQGMTELNHTNSNQKVFTVTKRSADTFSLDGTVASTFAAYSTGGTSYCVVAGCEYLRFTDNSSNIQTWQITTCVTERTTPLAQRYTDASPGANPVGRMYTSGAAGCPAATIVPLSTDRTALKNAITALKVTGTTAGQIGTSWGWYMVSPNFASLWPTASQPAAYTAPFTLKVAVIMTDGEFNTEYCNGVLAKGAGVGGTTNSCDPENGDGTAQALASCEAMREAGVIVYTVGFALGGNATAENFIRQCASGPENVYLPSGGGALKDAFAAIGRDIMKLRLTK